MAADASAKTVGADVMFHFCEVFKTTECMLVG